MKSKQKQESESPDLSSPIHETVDASDPAEQESENLLKRDEACPICHEILRNQKMVFQCGHSTCCNCNYFDLSIVCFSASSFKHFLCVPLIYYILREPKECYPYLLLCVCSHRLFCYD